MEQTTLGDTNLRVSRLCLGTMTFASQVDEPAAAAMLDLCLDRGVNFVDTANVYNRGASEQIVGRILKGRREQVVLASKVGIQAGEQPDQIGLGPATIVRQFEQTLERLQTDYLDIYYLHQPDYSTPLDATLEAIESLVRAGQIRYLGVSNYAAWQVAEFINWCADVKGFPRVQVTQPMYNLLARNIESEFLPMCSAFGLATVVYNPLAGGLLTGKHLADQQPQAGTRFDGNENYRQRYWHAENFAVLRPLREISAREGRSLVSLSLGWLLHHTQIDSVIVGASSLPQLAENMDAADEAPLSAAALATCDQVWDKLRGVSPKYNR